MPEPSFTGAGRGEIESIPEETRSLVVDYLREVSGVEEVQPGHLLSTDLGLDSLKLVELMTWIEHEFGVPQEDVEAFNTVGDCFLAAVGELESGGSSELKEVESSWFEGERVGLLEMPAGSNLAELFLAQAAVDPGRVVVADQLSGTKSYRDIITAIIALGPEIGKLEGESVGIMLPATATAAIVYFATLFAGKTPVMVNWTVGAANMRHSLGNAGVANVLTAHALLTKIKKQGLDYSSVGVNLIPLEEIGGRIGLMGKTFAVLRARFSWSPLRRARISETAAVLFTSGSESKPKTVPLTHANFIANMRDYSAQLGLRSDDSMLGMLPPFHSLGLAGNVIMPLCMGLKTVYHANPTEGALLAKLVSAYKTTLLLATPTFLGGILGSARRGELDSLRLVATGAEKCPDHVYGAFDRTCKEAVICEGYGITECSPVVSMNIPDSPVAGTIGKVLQSMEYLLIDTETGAAVDSKGQKGKLLLRGENVFAGYHNHDGKSPFVEYAGKQWYDTGDLVVERADGILAFAGRLKRFVKLAGEMISLPAVEDALAKVFLPGDDSILMAVEATADDKPELVLFTTLDVTRERVNRAITGSGLSPLHSIRRIVRLEEIPILGTGKTDYRSLKEMLK
ncbi:MAG: AMP-binding protein [Gammaproteobacteria bacterium]|nr:AMP-binding protein [Gammaproteobacteria bacterium]